MTNLTPESQAQAREGRLALRLNAKTTMKTQLRQTLTQASARLLGTVKLGSSFVQSFSALARSPDVKTHSIISVKPGGPIEQGDDGTSWPDTVWLSLLVALLGSVCTHLGPRTLPRDRFDYSDSISESWKRQTLLNIVKLRYLDPPIRE